MNNDLKKIVENYFKKNQKTIETLKKAIKDLEKEQEYFSKIIEVRNAK